MKVLLVNDYGTRTGGAENLVLSLRDALRARGHEARLFTSSARPLRVPVEADHTGLGTTSRFRTLLQSANPWAAHRLRAVLENFWPAVIHVSVFLTQLSPLILPLLRETPSLLHIADYRPICPVSSKQFPDGTACHEKPGAVCYREGCLPLRDWVPIMMQMRLWKRWQGAFDRVVANSGWVKRRLAAEGIEAQTTIWNGVPVRPARPPLEAPPTVGFAGRLVKQKGVGVLLRAMSEVIQRQPEAQLLIAGDGKERARIQQEIAERNLSSHVRLVGHCSREEMERHFERTWVQAVPSTWEEPFGLVAAEAMMRGTAVVASDTGGLGEVVQDGKTGLSVPPGEAHALARALLHVLGNRERAEQMGQAGRERALEAFSEPRMVEQFIALYERLFRKNGRA